MKNLTTIVKSNINIEQVSRGSSSIASHKQSLVVKTWHLSLEDADDLDNNNTPSHKSLRVNFQHSCVQSSTAQAHRDDDKVSIPDEEEMNWNLEALQGKSEDPNSGKDGANDKEDDDSKGLAQEVNKEEGLGLASAADFDNCPWNSLAKYSFISKNKGKWEFTLGQKILVLLFFTNTTKKICKII